jgi:outer membrane biosynthesis protein TonB
MATLGLNRDERIGLAVALALHAAVLAALFLDPHSDQLVEPPERIQVTISEDYGLTSTSPDPHSQAAPDIAPTIGEALPAPAPTPVPLPESRPSPLPPERTARPVEPARPAPQPKKTPSREKAASRQKSAIDDIVSRPSPPAAKSAPRPAEKTGGSRVGSDFLAGISGAQSAQGKGTPAAEVGPQVRSALSAAITRQLKPHWLAPQGPDAEELVTYLAFNLNRDGSLDGRPTVLRQTGITDINRNQAARHAEQAVRAVQLAAPFDLPPEYYDAWKRVTSFKFDKRLSQ